MTKKKQNQQKTKENLEEKITTDIPTINQTVEKKNTSAGDEKISVVNEEVEVKKIKDEDVVQPKTLTEEDKKARDNLFSATINEMMTFVINTTYLRESENKITKEEMTATQFATNMSETISFYFPNWNVNHPLFGLAASTGMLLLLINKKMPIDERQTNKTTGENNEAVENTDDGDAVNPYMDVPTI